MPGMDQDTTGGSAPASSNNRARGGLWKSQLGGWILVTWTCI